MQSPCLVKAFRVRLQACRIGSRAFYWRGADPQRVQQLRDWDWIRKALTNLPAAAETP